MKAMRATFEERITILYQGRCPNCSWMCTFYRHDRRKLAKDFCQHCHQLIEFEIKGGYK